MNQVTEQQVEALVDALVIGESVLTRVRAVNGNKVEVELAEKIKSANSSQAVNMLSIFNKGDERFNQSSGARRAWEIAEPAVIAELFSIDVDKLTSLTVGEILFLGIKNPSYNGMPLRIQIKETTKGSEYDLLNIEKKAKRKGKDGDFIMHNGQHIFSKTSIVALPEGQDPQHVILAEDKVDVNTGEIVSAPTL